jgi:hypothetical protein
MKQKVGGKENDGFFPVTFDWSELQIDSSRL